MEDHPLRVALTAELHARPFPVLETPCRAALLALRPAERAAERDRSRDIAHLADLLARHGVPPPPEGATHWFGDLGRFRLKFESHTEFVTYTLFAPGLGERPFDGDPFDAFPADWLADAPGQRVASALVRVETAASEEEMTRRAAEWMAPESLALSRVLDGEAVVASDFRIDEAGHVRLGVWVEPECGNRRLGRIVQRLCEIVTYTNMALLGLAEARGIGPALGAVESRLSDLTGDMVGETGNAEETLGALLEIGAELEALNARSSFRFAATEAYAALVAERVRILREARVGGRQTFAEFMSRRFEPAVRTVAAAQRRLHAMSDRAARAGELLRTRVDVERSAQNQRLLESMDARAQTALRLQETVEGLSIVAISYYAVGLALYLLGPLEGSLGKAWLAAAITPPVLLAVWLLLRRVRRRK